MCFSSLANTAMHTSYSSWRTTIIAFQRGEARPTHMPSLVRVCNPNANWSLHLRFDTRSWRRKCSFWVVNASDPHEVWARPLTHHWKNRQQNRMYWLGAELVVSNRCIHWQLWGIFPTMRGKQSNRISFCVKQWIYFIL